MRCIMSRAALLELIVLIIIVSGCNGTLSTQVVGRYKEATCIDKATETVKPCNTVIPEADVSVVMAISAPVTPPKKNGTDLPEQALSSYIQELSKNSKTAAELRKNLSANIEGESGPSSLRDADQFSGTLIVTVSQAGSFNPADRLERTEVKIAPTNAKIQSWVAVQTAYSTINAGKIQSSLQRGGELSLGISPSELPITIGSKVTQQATRSDELQITQRIEDVTPLIDDEGNIRILRHSGFGLDLTGNTLLTVTFVPTSSAYPELFSIKEYKDEQRNWLEPKKLALNTQITKVPRGVGDIKAKVTLKYTLRHVTSGDETYQESDDIVQEITRTTPPKEFILVPASQVERTTFGLFETSGKEMPLFVQRQEHPKITPLCFSNYGNAQDLLDYLNRPRAKQPAMIGSTTIGFSIPKNGSPALSPLKSEDIGKLEVRPGCLPP